MNKLVTVKSARYISEYVLEVAFNDGLRCEIDFLPWIENYPFFAPLRNKEYFQNFSVDEWTIVWPNGADIAPETLHSLALRNLQLQAA